MTIKQKFSSIDQSKLTADQKAFLTKIKDVTKNFTDAEMNKKVEAPLNGFIEKAKEKMPEAIKSAPVKRTGKAKTSQTRKPKRTAMSLAKEIRKEGESWKDAQARASKMMKEDSKDLSKTVETELDKLSKLVRSQKERKKLSGLSGTNIKRDSVRRAKPKGRRISKDGNVYYENRDNRTDRLAPNYPKNAPLLADGGYLTDSNFGTFQNQVFVGGGGIGSMSELDAEMMLKDLRKNGEISQLSVGNHGLIFMSVKGGHLKSYESYKDAYSHYLKSNKYAKGGGVRTVGNREYSYGRNWTNDHRHVNKGEDHEVKYTRKRFELGGVMATDLAGHTGGGTGGLNAGMPLNGFSNTGYTGLVGETGAMSSGEMFMAGGTLPSGAEQSYMITEALGNPAQHYAGGGKIKNQYAGRTPEDIWDSLSVEQRKHFLLDHYYINEEEFEQLQYKRLESEDKEIIDYYANRTWKKLSGDVRKAFTMHVKEGQYARGGGVRRVGNREYSYGRNWTNDHRHVNKGEDHEVKYTRKGKFLGIFDGGGETYSEKASQLKGGVNYYSVDIDLFNGDEIRDLTFKSLDKAKKEYLKYSKSMVYEDNDIMDIQLIVVYKNGDYDTISYNKGGALTNERLHVNHDEDYEVRYAKPRPSRKGYKGARKFMAGGSMETPRIYVADLEAYNNGRLVGEWLDLSDYNDADELMDAIQDVLKKSGGEEYAIHDYENFPSSMYSEYMGKRDFEELYEMMELAKDNDLPLEVVQEVVSQYDAKAVEEFYRTFDDAEDFAQELVDDLGIESFNNFESYLYISETDRRLLAQEMADSYVDDIRDEDGGNRLIEEAGMDVNEYEEADSETQEEMLDRAREIVYDEYYDTWYDGLNDPYYFLVEEQGMYSADDFAKANFVQVDYEKLGEDLEQDYFYVNYDGNLYVFNIR